MEGLRLLAIASINVHLDEVLLVTPWTDRGFMRLISITLMRIEPEVPLLFNI